jgi:hypothetical protein
MSPLAPQFGGDDEGARTVDTGPDHSAIIGSPSGVRADLVLTISREYQPGGSAPQSVPRFCFAPTWREVFEN